jgi:nondiscriminating aspartyl-tRNA synthetase
VKVWWHRELPIAHTSRGWNPRRWRKAVHVKPSAVPTRTLCADLPHLTGRETPVTIEGWIHRRRRLSTVTFLIIRDRTGLAQVVAADPDVRSHIDELTEETVVRVTGVLVRNPQAPGGREIGSPVVTLLSSRAQTPPVELWRPTLSASLPVLLDNAAVTWRHPARKAVWRLASASLHGFRHTLDRLGFTEILTPKIVAASTESGANVFALDYLGRPAFLAQSPQFYKQTMVGVFERVYETGPVFRAEPHDTVRHLAEYVSLDAELGFIDSHRDVLAVLREALAGMVDRVLSTADDAVQLTGASVPVVPHNIPTIHFTSALELVGADPAEPDLAPEHERLLGAWALREYGSDFLAVEGYPAAKRPFYTHPQTDDPRWTNSFDLLFRGLELVTGGQRLHRYQDYIVALAARGEDPAAHQSYLQAFRFGMPPHGGFAIGLERWIARLIGADNVRLATLFPRDVHRLTP